jgi:hypothetical protein
MKLPYDRSYRDFERGSWLGTCIIPVGRRSWWRRLLSLLFNR